MICTTVKIGCFSVFHAEHNWFGLSRDGLEETVETETERRKRGDPKEEGRHKRCDRRTETEKKEERKRKCAGKC